MKIQDICSSTNIFRVIKQKKKTGLDVWDVLGEGEAKCIKEMSANPEGKRQLGRPRHRWEDNSKMDLQGKVCEAVDCINLAWGREKRQANVSKKINFRKMKEKDG